MKCQNTNFETKKEQNWKITRDFKCQNFILIYLKNKKDWLVSCTLEHKTGRRHESLNTFKNDHFCVMSLH